MGIPINSEANWGIDTITGQPATTGGPLASGNPVKPASHPIAIEAMKRNKTGPYAERSEDGSSSEKYGASDWTQAGDGTKYPGEKPVEEVKTSTGTASTKAS